MRNPIEDASRSFGEGAECLKKQVEENAFVSVVTAFVCGAGVGLTLIALASKSRSNTSTAEHIGRSLVDSLSGISPDGVAKKLFKS